MENLPWRKTFRLAPISTISGVSASRFFFVAKSFAGC
jgi:hypothetical protein